MPIKRFISDSGPGPSQVILSEMCGIHVVISKAVQPSPPSSSFQESLCNRGPDHVGQYSTTLRPKRKADSDHDDEGTTFLTFTSTVLSLRGDGIAYQPFVHPKTASVLCWNGEAWKIDGRAVKGNDGEAIFALLTEASVSAAGDEAAIVNVLRSIRGPFAFVYFDNPSGRVYFGRDRLGRRSLLTFSNKDDQSLTISSISGSCDSLWKEVEADGIYICNILGHSRDSFCKRNDSLPGVSRTPWLPQDEDEEDIVLGLGRFNTSVPSANTLLLSSSNSVKTLGDQLLEAVRQRVLGVPPPPPAENQGSTPASDTRMAILFSGGLDCTVLARLSHDLLPNDHSIDLLNVAFENPRIASHLQKQARGAEVDAYEACPDRVTGRKALAELQKACPGRNFRFVAANVPYTEATSHRAQVVSLMYPHDTEMDLSIAYALYFAARGEGLVHDGADPSSAPTAYRTPARVLVSGLGADELFGGYLRHATAYAHRGYEGLVDELKLDVGRLGKRNLGRDDRVMAHWGKEIRFPYLDEELVKWAIGRPAWEKCDFDNAEDVSGVEPGKRILRLLALGLGLTQVAREKKRAIQFGSRTAKMESNRVKGTAQVS